MKPAQSAKTRKGVESTLRTSKAKYEQSGGLLVAICKIQKKIEMYVDIVLTICVGW